MNSRRMILVDVGNSAVKVAALPCSGPLQSFRFGLREPGWPATLVAKARRLFDEGESEIAAPHHWVVASVNGPATEMLREQVAADSPGDPWYELAHGDVPIEVGLRNPAAVGIDRLLGASAAWQSSLAGRTPEGAAADELARTAKDLPAVISIDAGSAVTVDLVRQGVFLGGAILPGLRMQLASLTRGTDLLPAASHDAAGPLEIPGRDTVSAMQTGVMLGLGGGIDRLIECYSEGCTLAPHVFLTGGDAGTLEPLLTHPVNRREDLVLSAMGHAAAALDVSLVTDNDDGEI